jgi:hypothetical protein
LTVYRSRRRRREEEETGKRRRTQGRKRTVGVITFFN